MPPLDALTKAVLDAGGWVVAAIVAVGIIAAIIRGDLVPGTVYKREVTRADLATSQLESWNRIGETLTAQVDVIADLVASILKPRAR